MGEAVAALEAGGDDEDDWSDMARGIYNHQPDLYERLRLSLPTGANRADLVKQLGSLANPFTLLRTNLNGLRFYYDHPDLAWEAEQQAVEEQEYEKARLIMNKLKLLDQTKAECSF